MSHSEAKKCMNHKALIKLDKLWNACDQYDSYERGKRDGYDHSISIILDSIDEQSEQ